MRSQKQHEYQESGCPSFVTSWSLKNVKRMHTVGNKGEWVDRSWDKIKKFSADNRNPARKSELRPSNGRGGDTRDVRGSFGHHDI